MIVEKEREGKGEQRDSNVRETLELYHKYVLIRKKLYMGFGTICGFKLPPGGLEHVPPLG